MISIVIAEDHQLVRNGLNVLLTKNESFQVLGEAANGKDALKLVETKKPDVLLTDVVMPEMNGIELTELITERALATRVLLLSMYDKDAFVVDALNKGASGYITKGASSEELSYAICEVAKGNRYLCSSLSERAIQAYLNNESKASSDTRLTARELEIIKLTAEGYNAAAISRQLNISSRTVENHRSNAMTKIGVKNQAELVRFVLTDLVIPTS